MRKLAKIYFLILGVSLIVIGIIQIKKTRDLNKNSKILYERTIAIEGLEDMYGTKRHYEPKQEWLYYFVVAGGVIFFIIGSVQIAKNSNPKRINEEDITELKTLMKENVSSQTGQNNPSHTDNPPMQKTTTYDKFSELEKLGKLKEQGLLTEEEFQQQKRKILE